MTLPIILAALNLAIAILNAFSSLSPDVRDDVVRMLLHDKAKREAVWEEFTKWFGGMFNRLAKLDRVDPT